MKNVSGKGLFARIGEWDTQTKNEIYPHVDHQIESWIIHEKFDKGPLYNDVALLFLKTPVQAEKHINTICLPPQDTIFDFSRCFASGWGKDEFGRSGKYQVILKKIELPVVPFNTCQSSLRETRLGKRFRLHENFLCAGGEVGKGWH